MTASTRASCRVLTLLAPFACAPAALAADDAPLELAPVQVLGETYRNTATKTALEPSETPQSISIIDPVALEMRGVDSVAESLRYVSGVNTQLRGGTATRFDLYNIRGFHNDQNYYDGLQLLYNDWNLQPQIDLHAVEQVEVFKGPTSTLYGAMPPGGMVNLISKKPSSEPYNSVELATGSHDLLEANFETAGRIGDSALSYSVVGLARDKDGQAKTSREERRMIAPSLDWRVNDRTLVNFNLYYQDDPELGIYNSLPARGMFLANPNGKLPVDAFAGDKNWDHYEREVLMAGYKINHEFNDTWSFLQNFRYTDATASQENTYGLGLDAQDSRTLGRRAYMTDEATEGFTVDNQVSGAFDTAWGQHNLLFGVDYLYLDSDIVHEDGTAPSIDLFAPDHDQIDRSTLALALSSDFQLKKEQLGFYLQDQVRLDRWVLIAGLRYDDYENTEEGLQYGAAVDRRRSGNEVTYRAGALYEFDSGISPFVSYAQSFEPETGADRFGNAFDPSEGEQWEAGIKYNSADTATALTFAAFRIDKTNVPTRDPSGGPYDQIQAGELRSQGVELEASRMPLENLLLALTYTYQDVEFTKDYGGLEGGSPEWVPEQLLSLWADYSVLEGALSGVELGGGVRYIGEAPLGAGSSGKVPDATLVDFAVDYDLGYLSSGLTGARATLSVNNVFDERHYSCYDVNNCWFGAERSVEARVSYSF